MQQDETPKRKAVALRYEPEVHEAPVVTAKGKGFLAEKIIEVARESGVPIKEDPQLVEYLGMLDIGKEIPPELYQVVAEILAFVYRLDKKNSTR